MRIGVNFSEDVPLERQRAAARDVEAAGLASLWTSDQLGRDPFLLNLAWAEVTERIDLGVGVAQILTRTPVQLAKAAVTIQEAAEGRFRLGVGVSQPQAMEGWHGVPMPRRPLTATRDTIEIIRALTAGETTDHDGERSSKGARLAITPGRAVPIYLGAMKPRALALGGSHADGVLLSWESAPSVAHAVGAVVAAAREAGRPRPRIACYVRIAIADERDTARSALASQVAAYWPYYAGHFASQGLEREVAAGDRAVAQGDADALADDLLLALGWYGTPHDDVGPLLERYAEAGVDELVARYVTIGDPVESLRRTLVLLAG